MGELIYLTGPVRSGKSARAVEIARGWGDDVVFVAPWWADPADLEMAERVRKHRAERPESWRTLEAPDRIDVALSTIDPPPAGVIVDSIVVWTAARFVRPDDDILQEWRALLDALCAAPYPTVVVGDEIGWSPVPMEADLRRFRDLVGLLAQATAAHSTESWLIVSGCPLRLK
ncbi:cobalamin biosynthesis protein [Rhodoblastus sphagnicola]|uniref:Bifunctional adenosylcobalamin biosynthesis protein n=1 Tax=Rhodoblastus sphagnicola TaxID=333368 RepID=A0A2S6NDF2_9HYPH|nr:bifunctional adenosylcobinamide kinase/adenosylcobinamide-phosphate guanylyltransferase [Rhodoblastus sphagnicola]MBB4201041.1 adenosyl cobinamide kinase/adenosyl cobinamide phosphate guanylyltransferase [Rhodoblastus sphagnicola]PPQ32637.1 cobalamin biosynthesis protein [Rhodoblastus sphagnicola]